MFLVRLRLIQLSIVISVKIITRVASNISYLCVYLVFYLTSNWIRFSSFIAGRTKRGPGRPRITETVVSS